MKDETYIQINTPCHENWAKMTPEDKGRFCSLCNKSVIDFSLMTDNEILKHLKKENSDLCGRFSVTQLQRPIRETQLQPKKNWRYWLASISALLFLINRSEAQTKNAVNTHNNPSITPKDSMELTKGKILITPTATDILKGTVVDSAGKPMEGASIRVKENGVGVTADNKGNFHLNIKHLPETFTIVVAYIGYETQRIPINKATLKEVTIRMKEEINKMTGEVVIVRKKSPKSKNK